MSEQTEYKPGTAFVIDPENGLAIPEEQYLAEQAAKAEQKPAKSIPKITPNEA
ncbi:MAG: hypothetical protein M0R47_15850 [Methylobacter sp.]|uniref:hypothetical protein n=1 Tax=Methylobacter sp. TaxID=2051955 RepID=UPI0025F209E6|nr:hypothetical protein [Methylobacter sp.]MCK9621994.1 hypothetical protein [Methylobacter sp.]